MNVDALQPRRHDSPLGWSAATFEAITAALAAALVASHRHDERSSASSASTATGVEQVDDAG